MNSMCLSCSCLNNDCSGTDNKVWSGCIYRKPTSKFKENIRKFNEIKYALAEKGMDVGYWQSSTNKLRILKDRKVVGYVDSEHNIILK